MCVDRVGGYPQSSVLTEWVGPQDFVLKGWMGRVPSVVWVDCMSRHPHSCVVSVELYMKLCNLCLHCIQLFPNYNILWRSKLNYTFVLIVEDCKSETWYSVGEWTLRNIWWWLYWFLTSAPSNSPLGGSWSLQPHKVQAALHNSASQASQSVTYSEPSGPRVSPNHKVMFMFLPPLIICIH